MYTGGDCIKTYKACLNFQKGNQSIYEEIILTTERVDINDNTLAFLETLDCSGTVSMTLYRNGNQWYVVGNSVTRIVHGSHYFEGCRVRINEVYRLYRLDTRESLGQFIVTQSQFVEQQFYDFRVDKKVFLGFCKQTLDYTLTNKEIILNKNRETALFKNGKPLYEEGCYALEKYCFINDGCYQYMLDDEFVYVSKQLADKLPDVECVDFIHRVHQKNWVPPYAQQFFDSDVSVVKWALFESKKSDSQSYLILLLPLLIMSLNSWVYSGRLSVVSLLAALMLYGFRLFDDRRRQQKEKNKYLENLAKKVSHLKERQAKEKLVRQIPNVTQWQEMVAMGHPMLFSYTKDHPYFLNCLVGVGEDTAWCRVEKISDEQVRSEVDVYVQKIIEEYSQLKEIGVRVHLDNNVCIVGEKRMRLVVQWLLELALFHCVNDVVIYYISSDMDDFLPSTFLPHLHEDYGIATTKEKHQQVYEHLKEQMKCAIVFVVGDVVYQHDWEALKQNGREIYFVYVGEQTNRLAPIVIEATRNEVIIHTQSSTKQCQYIDLEYSFDDMSRALSFYAPTQPSNVITNEYHSLTFFDLYCVKNANQLMIRDNWQKNSESIYLKAVVGKIIVDGHFTNDCFIDLVAQGPHILVAGTTGSGKSEWLLTLLLSLGCTYSPESVQFVLVDFKGGGLAYVIEKMPHIAGIITNIDQYNALRYLHLLNAEVKRRQQLFRQEKVNHINNYRCYCGQLPRLVVIVDEFAQLKKDFPMFIDGLLSIARIGRTLGIHLILATQKPGGVIDGQILANTQTKVCLRVNSIQESKEVLGDDKAYHLTGVGQAIVQTHSDMFKMYSAYAMTSIDNIIVNRKMPVWLVEKTQDRQLISGNQEPWRSMNQVDAIIYEMNAQWKKQACVQQTVFTSELPNKCIHPQKQTDEIAIGLIDDVHHQCHVEATIDLVCDTIICVGAKQMGKTTFLNTVSQMILKQANDSVLYGINIPNFNLGIAIPINEHEKMESVFNVIERLLVQRRQLAASQLKDVPRCIVLIDNYENVKDIYPKVEYIITRLLREGVALKFTLIITVTHIKAIRHTLLAQFSRKIPLHCIDTNDYYYLIGKTSYQLPSIPGRILWQDSTSCLVGQLYVTDESGVLNKDIPKQFLPRVIDRQLIKSLEIQGLIGVNKDTYEAVYFQKYVPIVLIGQIIDIDSWIMAFADRQKVHVVTIDTKEKLRQWMNDEYKEALIVLDMAKIRLWLYDENILEEELIQIWQFKKMTPFICITGVDNMRVTFQSDKWLQFLQKHAQILSLKETVRLVDESLPRKRSEWVNEYEKLIISSSYVFKKKHISIKTYEEAYYDEY